ncbi:MAG: DUF362 domain-containing protein [Anaerolineales bacterium]
MPLEAKYACKVVDDRSLVVRQEHNTSSPKLRNIDPGQIFSGYEIYVQEPGVKVWMSTGDGWVTALWPTKWQAEAGVGTTERIKYTEIAPPPSTDDPPPSTDDNPPPSTSRKVVRVLLTYDDGSTQEFSTPASTDQFFSLHPFIEAHPEAVFIKRTDVPAKTDTQAKKSVGFEFAQEIFIYGSTGGLPLSRKIAIKANVTHTEGLGLTPDGMGIITDKYFTEGLIEGMKGLGFQSNQMYLREGNWLKDGYCSTDLMNTGYVEMAERTGIHSLYFSEGRRITDLTLENLQAGTEVVWKDCPNGVVFKRVGYMSPYNLTDSWLINISKFKTHYMGMTLCAKNLQGMCVSPHVRFCENDDAISQRPASILRDFQPDFAEHIAALYAQHLKAGIPRWDRPGTNFNGGYGVERWSQRTCDSLSVTDVGLNVIEGIYGRNGNGFMKGPGPEGKAEDFMTNILIFGKDPFRVDIIGTWLAGHEPGNFGFFHIAKERGLSNVVNPRDIPVYIWDKQDPQQTSLSNLERTPLVTSYLCKDYNGQNEALYHLVDEPFDYQSF